MNAKPSLTKKELANLKMFCTFWHPNSNIDTRSNNADHYDAVVARAIRKLLKLAKVKL